MLNKIRGATASVFVAAVVLTGIAACDDPLGVETSSRIPAVDVETPANAQLLVDGAIADFECAFAAYVYQSATVGEEFIYAQQLADRLPADRRAVTPTDTRYSINRCEDLGIYVPLQTARNTAENVLNYLNVWTDAEVANRTRLISFAAAYAGYSYVLLGEGFCTMAVSRINPDRSITYGGEIQRDSVFRLAIARFTEAITAATAANNTEILRMAFLGRARAKLNLGDYAGAKADAQQIPAGYVKNAAYADVDRRRNQVFLDNNTTTARTSSVGPPYRTMNDTRVPVTQGTGLPSPTGIVHWGQGKYTTVGAPIPLATYEEAQLIIAEADIRSGSLATALPILNASRARGGNTTPFAGTTQAEYMAELVEQRRRELFLESHHLADIIRYGISPTPSAGTPYHFGGGVYGTQICFPLPASERLNNPRIGV
jgi:hypothetical protein